MFGGTVTLLASPRSAGCKAVFAAVRASDPQSGRSNRQDNAAGKRQKTPNCG